MKYVKEGDKIYQIHGSYRHAYATMKRYSGTMHVDIYRGDKCIDRNVCYNFRSLLLALPEFVREGYNINIIEEQGDS